MNNQTGTNKTTHTHIIGSVPDKITILVFIFHLFICYFMSNKAFCIFGNSVATHHMALLEMTVMLSKFFCSPCPCY
jgi:hypothetical protein